MSGPNEPPIGLFASLRRLLGTALELAQVRLALLGTELERAGQRLLDGLLWGGAALIVLGVGLMLLCAFLLMLVREDYRLAALGGLTVIFLGAAVWLLQAARSRLRSLQNLFELSINELKQDLPPSGRD
jgi:uncharacterized membrane protein YqjE